MSYEDKINYLINTEKTFEGKEIPNDINRRYSIIKEEVKEFELNVFNILYNSIMNEKTQIEFLKKQKDSSNDELFHEYLDKEINKHKENIKLYGEQVYSLYSRETFIKIFEKRKEACQRRINYNSYQMEINANEEQAGINLRYENNYMKELNNALNILNGTMLEMINSYINISEIGHRL